MKTLGIFLGLISIGAGATEVGRAPPSRIPPVSAEVISPLPAGNPVDIATLPREVRRAVVADAAKRLGLAESAIVLTQAESVTWNDGSLGCPEPGRMYTQSLVPGYRVVAKTADGELAYHTDSRGQVVNCASSRPTSASKLSEKSPVRGSTPGTQPRTPDR